MPNKRFDENTKARAVRLVREHADDYDSEWAAMCAVSARLGMTAETLRKWVRQAEVDAGEAAGVPSETARELRELRRKNRELEAKSSRPQRVSSRGSATRYAMLSLLYGVDELAAFEMLRRSSQESNVKLRSLAAQLVADFRALATKSFQPGRSTTCSS